MILWFGEHNGKELSEVPLAYLNWLLNDTEPDIGKHDSPAVIKRKRDRWQDLMSEVEDELERRETAGRKRERKAYDDDDEDRGDDSFSDLQF